MTYQELDRWRRAGRRSRSHLGRQSHDQGQHVSRAPHYPQPPNAHLAATQHSTRHLSPALFRLTPARLVMASIPNARVSRSTFSPQVTLYTPVQDSEEVKPDATWVRRSSRSAASVKPEPDVKPVPKPTRSRHFKAEVSEEEAVVKEAKAEVKPKPAKAAKPKVFKRYLEVAHPAPKRWREAFEIIKEQRKG